MWMDRWSGRTIGAAIAVHRAMGPGLLESVYERCLAHELAARGIPFELQRPVPICYRGAILDGGLRLDLLVGGELVVELKSVERLLDLHDAQLLTYLRMTGSPVGLLLNFNTRLLRDGIRRLVNDSPDRI